MKLSQMIMALVATCTMAVNAGAATVSYSDAASFAAATSNTSTIDFNNGMDQSYRGTSYSEGGVTFTANGGVFSIYDASYDASYHPDGYIDLEGDTLGMAFDSPVTALAFKFGGFYDNPVELSIVLSTGESFLVSTAAGYGFFGITSSSAFSSISITTANLYTAFDDLTFGAAAAVPEPGTIALCALGLVGFAASRRKSASRSAA